MKIQFHKNFIKNYNSRFSGNVSVKRRLRERTDMFSENPANPILRDHPLKGVYIVSGHFQSPETFESFTR